MDEMTPLQERRWWRTGRRLAIHRRLILGRHHRTNAAIDAAWLATRGRLPTWGERWDELTFIMLTRLGTPRRLVQRRIAHLRRRLG